MKVLVVAAHPDDEAIGCGGALRLHADRGDETVVVFLTSGEVGLSSLEPATARAVREREAEAAAEVLGVSRLSFLRQPDWHLRDHVAAAAGPVAELLTEGPPGLLYLPCRADDHPDHAAVADVLRAAAALAGIALPVTREFEVWTPLQAPNDAEDISSVMAAKLDSIRCYRSQLEQRAYDRAAEGLAAYRGVMLRRTSFAEAFHLSSGLG